MLKEIIIKLNDFFLDCQCSAEGSVDSQCDDKGQCTCHEGYGGLQCQTSLGTFLNGSFLASEKELSLFRCFEILHSTIR